MKVRFRNVKEAIDYYEEKYGTNGESYDDVIYAKYLSDELDIAAIAKIMNNNEPKTYNEAVKSDGSALWEYSMKEEYYLLIENEI